jgi:hypothetical protein
MLMPRYMSVSVTLLFGEVSNVIGNDITKLGHTQLLTII